MALETQHVLTIMSHNTGMYATLRVTGIYDTMLLYIEEFHFFPRDFERQVFNPAQNVEYV